MVVGAGAAGFMAALFAARAGAQTVLLEAGRKPGLKILASGGGRCNVLPSETRESDFFSHGSLKPARNVLRRWPLERVHQFFEDDLRVPLKVEETGKVFPRSDSARDVVRALKDSCAAAGVELRTNHKVHQMVQLEGAWQLRVADRPSLVAQRVILATGGLSLPKSGSDGTGWRILAGLGHSMTERYPALVPLTWSARDLRDLAGVSLTATLEARMPNDKLISREEGDVLLTHRGLSGPATLQISRHFAAPTGAELRLVARWGQTDWREALADKRAVVSGALRQRLPRRLADLLVERAGVPPQRRLSQLSKAERKSLLRQLERCPWRGPAPRATRPPRSPPAACPCRRCASRP